jgi:hypothetical protein
MFNYVSQPNAGVKKSWKEAAIESVGQPNENESGGIRAR